MSIFDYLTGPVAFGKFLDKTMLPKETTRFFADSTGNRIGNIPYEKYIKPMVKPENAVVPDGLSQSNTAEENGRAIQQAVDSLGDGGTVYIPEGCYYTNTIRLKSNMTLFVPEGAELISISWEDNEKSSEPLFTSVVYAEKAENITLTGGGTINGNGLSYTDKPAEEQPLYALRSFNTYLRTVEARKRIHFGKDTERNHVLYFKNCKGIHLENILLRDSAFWTVKFDNCFDVVIRDFIIDNHLHIANSDGVDICGGENYDISHCFIACADDAVCIKSPEYSTKNVRVSDCILSSCANCFKIGTETCFDISDIQVENCCFFMPDGMTYGYSGLAIESCDGANVKNISISDITMEGISSPLLIWLGNRLRYDKNEVGTIENISIKNITAKNTEMPCAVVGCVDKNKQTHYVRNVRVEGFTATYRDTAEQLNIRKKVGEYTMTGYPDITRVSHIYYKSHEMSKYWDLPCYGVCVKHAENISYESIKTTPRSCNKRKEFYLHDVK